MQNPNPPRNIIVQLGNKDFRRHEFSVLIGLYIRKLVGNLSRHIGENTSDLPKVISLQFYITFRSWDPNIEVIS